MKARVIYGSNNVYLLRCEDGLELEGRIKGKILKGSEGDYNPLASGDWVEIELSGEDTALISDLIPRKNAFSRWNAKGRSVQILAAGLDAVICIGNRGDPPFRPRFLDRLLVQADIANIPAIIVVNKIDIEDDDLDREERLEDYRRLGYTVLEVSAHTKEGLDNLSEYIEGKTGLFVGQSGVGKTSLLNALDPTLSLRTQALNQKYQRGRHTTTMAMLHELSGFSRPTALIDSPGIRLMGLADVEIDMLHTHFREFAPLVGKCSFGLSCRHEREPGCKILEAVDAGFIHEDRYESFIRLREELEARTPYWERNK